MQYLDLDSKIIILGFFSGTHLFKQEEWQAFTNRGLHLINLTINGLLTKIDELRGTAKRTKTAVIGISESKLHSTDLGSKFYIENMRCYMRSGFS